MEWPRLSTGRRRPAIPRSTRASRGSWPPGAPRGAAPRSGRMTDALGSRLGQEVRPIDRVAVYVPGGRAAYPSTVLMTVIPARVAGVKEIVLVSPPAAGGSLNAAVLVGAPLRGAAGAA